MDQQTQAQTPPPAQQPAGQQPAKSSSKIWLWILGGCLGIIIIGMLIMGGLAWWGAKKVKKAIKENQPQWEEVKKDAEKWKENSEEMQKATEDWQKEMEKLQKAMPTPPSE